MNIEINEMALICSGSITNRKKSEKYLKRLLRNVNKYNVPKRLIQRALNLVKKMSQQDFEREVNIFIQETFYTNHTWN
jgi:hypothetical protein